MSTSVEAVADARDVMRMLRKDADATWVAGLSPADDLFAERQKAMAAAEMALAEGVVGSHSIVSPWLRAPLLLIIVALLVSGLASSVAPTSIQRMSFPQSELVLWDLARYGSSGVAHSIRTYPDVEPVLGDAALDSNSFLGLALVGESLLIFGSGLLCFRMGVATASFLAFCGIGCALLSLGGLAVDSAMFLWACGEGAECNYPFISHWISVGVRRVGTSTAILLAVSALGLITTESQAIRDAKTSPTLGLVASARKWVSKNIWTLVAAIGPASYLMMFSFCGYMGRPFPAGVELAGGLDQCALIAVVWRLWMQPPLRTVSIRPHLD